MYNEMKKYMYIQLALDSYVLFVMKFKAVSSYCLLFHCMHKLATIYIHCVIVSRSQITIFSFVCGREKRPTHKRKNSGLTMRD